MADRAISELIAANQVAPTDLFVLEQSGTAKKLTGQILENWLLSLADGHGGIKDIVKQSTSGLKDTYRITLADSTTFDFIVTNGKSISSLKQTSSAGLKRTYTIAFNDGTSQTFDVTDGRSVTNIAKTGTNVLTDTYTISYNDSTSSTFTVKNGKGINSFAKVSTVGLVDTYRIEYNDGTSDEFTVTNGAKGDKGENQYVWIKYASQKPTASSHSIGDIPDNWIGVYSGASATAPTDWTQYAWFEIKGEKGDTGEAATLVNTAVEYQVGDSGTIMPSGAWSTSVPMVAQGKYMWTRTTNTFNTGSPVVAYSVARMGIDGDGSVSSVNDVSPDSDGNISLTASDVNALPVAGGYMEGPINMNGQKLEGLNDPATDTEVATKHYVDNKSVDLTGYAKESWVQKEYQPKGSYLTSETDPTVPAWAKAATKPSYTADEVGARPSTWMPTAYEVGAAASSHNHSASDINSGTLNSNRLPTVPVTKGGTGATTAANARTNLGITPENIGAMDASKLITLYNVTIALTNGVGTYSNSNIKSSSRCFAQRRVDKYMSGLQSVVGTHSAAGAVTVVMDISMTGNISANIIIFNS